MLPRPLSASRPSRLPPVWLTLAAFAFEAWLFWPLSTTDFSAYLLPWFDHIRATGPIAAFAHPFSDYAPPYLYLLAMTTCFPGVAAPLTLVKLLSIVGTAALALALRVLLRAAGAPEPERAAALVTLLPTVSLNALLLTQCDAFYAAAVVMVVSATVRERPRSALAWCGVAVAIKAQGVFIAPFLLAWLLARRVPMRWWPITPLVTLALWLPAAEAGWPITDLLTIYLRQGSAYPALALNASTVGQIAMMLPGVGQLPLKGLLLAAALGAAVAYTAAFSTRLGRGEALIAPALLCVLVVVGLLPMMHERYFFVADVLALTLALVRRDGAGWLIAGGVQAGSLLALLGYLTGIAAFAPVGAVAMILVAVRLGRSLWVRAANDDLPASPAALALVSPPIRG